MSDEVMRQIKEKKPRFIKFSYTNGSGQEVVRTMHCKYVDSVNNIIFITESSSQKIQCLQKNDLCAISFKPCCKPATKIVGHAKMYCNNQENSKLYQELVDCRHFPQKELGNPAYIVLVVQPERVMSGTRVLYQQ